MAGRIPIATSETATVTWQAQKPRAVHQIQTLDETGSAGSLLGSRLREFLWRNWQ